MFDVQFFQGDDFTKVLAWLSERRVWACEVSTRIFLFSALERIGQRTPRRMSPVSTRGAWTTIFTSSLRRFTTVSYDIYIFRYDIYIFTLIRVNQLTVIEKGFVKSNASNNENTHCQFTLKTYTNYCINSGQTFFIAYGYF